MKITILILISILQHSLVVSASEFNENTFIIAEAEKALITEDEASKIASKATGGQVISSETSGTAGVTFYSFKVLMTDGRVDKVKVNAKTGEVQ